MSDARPIVIAAVGWTGHVFPALSLARELRSRGEPVVFESSERWRDAAEGLGATFAAAPDAIELPGVNAQPGAPTLADATREAAERLAKLGARAVVADLWTVAPAFAAETIGVPRATLIPHPFPVREAGLPFYPLGLQPPRTPVGRLGWRAAWPWLGTRLPNTRLRTVRAALDRTRGALRLAPLGDYDGQVSDQLALVATFPQLEYPRRWPSHVHVTGPLPFELPGGQPQLPPGDEPLVVVAASTERDPGDRLIRTTLAALADEPVRVLATINRRGERWEEETPANATVVDWAPYSEVLPRAAALITHGGHGTLARALAAGVPALVVPAAGDMAENGARLTWSGAGSALPWRLLATGPLRLATRRLLADPRFRRAAGSIADWAREHDGPARAANLVERLAGGHAYR